MPRSTVWPSDENAALLTDLYQLTMLQAYRGEGMRAEAVFTLFVRRLRHRRYGLFCGLGTALDYLETLRFPPALREQLRTLDAFDDDFVDSLADFRFRGDVWAMPEGTVFFPDEPLMEIVAPIDQAQLVETFLLNVVTFQSGIASKAARVVRAARGRDVVDFGMRRMHGLDATLQAVRAYRVAGVAATSNVLGGLAYGLEPAGTMAHSYIEAHADEVEAMRAFTRRYPHTTLLVDTYDTLRGVDRVVALAREGLDVGAVRLDSGDLAALAHAARARLDAAGLGRVRIVASGSLDEHAIARLLDAEAPIDAFGVGTRMGTMADRPYLDTAYKLSAYDGQPRMKLATDKTSLPGRKQVWRRTTADGRLAGDVIGRADEALEGEPLLVRVMAGGVRTDAGRDDLAAAAERARAGLDALPDALHRLDEPAPGDVDPVSVSPALAHLADDLRSRLQSEHETP